MTKVYIFLTTALLIVLLLFVVFYHDMIADKWNELTATPKDIYEEVPDVTGREVFDAWDEALNEMESDKESSSPAEE